MRDADQCASTLDGMRREVAENPGELGPRLRLGVSLLECDSAAEAAAELQLAARMVPDDPHVALLAIRALVEAGRAHDAALLMSSHLKEQRGSTRLTDEEVLVIEGLLRHREPFVRCHTARAIGRLRFFQCMDALEVSCHDTDGSVRIAAETSMAQLEAR